MAIRELDYIIDTLTDTELSGVNQALRGLTNRRIPLEPRHIVGFNVMARPDSRTAMMRLTINDFPLLVDYTNPQNGKSFLVDSAPRKASLVLSNPVDPTHSTINFTTTTNGIKYNGSTFSNTGNISIIQDYMIELDLVGISSNGSWSGSPSSWNAPGIHMVELYNLRDIDGTSLEQSAVFAWSVQSTVSDIDPGNPFPYTKDIKHGTYKVARIVIDRSANIEDQLSAYLNSRGISRDNVLHQALLTTQSATLELYILYFDVLYPRIIQMYPNQGSNTPLDTPPDNLIFVFSDSVDTACLRSSGNVLIDEIGVPESGVTFSETGTNQTKKNTIMLVNPASVTSGTNSGLHTVRISQICNNAGVVSSAPPLFINYSIATMNTGGVDIDPYLHTGLGGTVDGPVIFNTGALVTMSTGFTIPGATVGSVLYYDGTRYNTLIPGNSGDSLTTNGPGEIPVWKLATGSGGVTGNAFVTFVMPTGSNIVASVPNDTFTFATGDNLVVVSGDSATKTVTTTLTQSNIDHTLIANVGTKSHATIDAEIAFISGENLAVSGDLVTHVSDVTNPHAVTLEQINGISSGDFVTHTSDLTYHYALSSKTLNDLGDVSVIGVSQGALLYRDIGFWGDIPPSADTGKALVSAGINATPNYSNELTTDNFTGHTGDLTTHFTESSIDHTNILSIGTNSHATIDSHIANSAIHYLQTSIDHGVIKNIGINTHNQIDTHLASTANPHSVTAQQVGAVSTAQFSTGSSETGSLLYHNGSQWTNLAPGASGETLITFGTGNTLGWQITTGNGIDSVSDGTTTVSSLTGLTYTGAIIVTDNGDNSASVAVDQGAVMYTNGLSHMGGNKLYLSDNGWWLNTVTTQAAIGTGASTVVTFDPNYVLLEQPMRMNGNSIVHTANTADRIDFNTTNKIDMIINDVSIASIEANRASFSSDKVSINATGISYDNNMFFTQVDTANGYYDLSYSGVANNFLYRAQEGKLTISPSAIGSLQATGALYMNLGQTYGLEVYQNLVSPANDTLSLVFGNFTPIYITSPLSNAEMKFQVPTIVDSGFTAASTMDVSGEATFQTGVYTAADITISGGQPQLILDNGTYTTSIGMATGQGASFVLNLPTGAPPGDNATLKWSAAENALVWVAGA